MLPSAVEQRWQEVLRRAAIALKGGGVGVWEADPGGRLRLLATSEAEGLAPMVADDLEATLSALGVLPPRRGPGRWVASRLKGRRWCIAPVRRDAPRPPPAGLERRGRERLTLELAGVCIGLIDEAQFRDVESLAPRGDPRSGPRDSLDHRRRVARHLTGGRRPQVPTDLA